MLWLTNTNEQKNCPNYQEKVVLILDKDQNYRGSGCWRIANKKNVLITIKYPNLSEPFTVPLDKVISDSELKREDPRIRKK